MILSISAAYHISYGPYVADYSRYLAVGYAPRAGVLVHLCRRDRSGIWIMLLGAGIQTAFAAVDAMTATVNVASGAWAPGCRSLTVIILVVGLGNIGALNVYGAMMSSLTIVTSVLRQSRVPRFQRIAFIVVLAAVTGLIAGVGAKRLRARVRELHLLHHHLPDPVVGDQPGRLLPGPQGPLRRRRHVHAGRSVRPVQCRRPRHLRARLHLPDSVHQRGVLHRSDRRQARLRRCLDRRSDRSRARCTTW